MLCFIIVVVSTCLNCLSLSVSSMRETPDSIYWLALHGVPAPRAICAARKPQSFLISWDGSAAYMGWDLFPPPGCLSWLAVIPPMSRLFPFCPMQCILALLFTEFTPGGALSPVLYIGMLAPLGLVCPCRFCGLCMRGQAALHTHPDLAESRNAEAPQHTWLRHAYKATIQALHHGNHSKLWSFCGFIYTPLSYLAWYVLMAFYLMIVDIFMTFELLIGDTPIFLDFRLIWQHPPLALPTTPTPCLGIML